jgi:hypothetical protein
MIDNNDGHNNIEESVIAKSTGKQEEEDIAVKDALYSKSVSQIILSILELDKFHDKNI